MKQTKLFTKTQRDNPANEESKNAQLLIRAGYINKELAGVYDLLPLGIRVIENIKKIIREELEKLEAEEVLMSSLQDKSIWKKTGRWSDEIVNVWFKSELKSGGDIGFGWSHEEPFTELMKSHIHSFRDLPVYAYQFQNKLRNELRAKSGLMRGREFIMKDMYSFSSSSEEHEIFYQKTIQAYKNIFNRLGIGQDTFVTFASGGAFTKFSHEFQTVCEVGEDVTYLNKEKGIAINEEVLDENALEEASVSKDELMKTKTAEVANIFNFGTEKSEQLGLYFSDTSGKKVPVHLGSYGIGVTRVMGVIAEKDSDESGLIWSDEIAPFRVHIISIKQDESAFELYSILKNEGIDTLIDDRDVSAGQKFSDSDLIGIPHRVVVSEKTIREGLLEYKGRSQDNSQKISKSELIKLLHRKE